MSISYDGTSLVFDGTVTITNFTDPTTGVVTMTLTPAGGLGKLPALINGQPGQPAIFDTPITVSTLSPGASATATLTQVSPGGPGTSSHYTLALGLPAGAAGATGASGTIAGASDLTTSAAKGSIIAVTGTGPTAFQYKPFPWCNVYNVASYTEASSSGQATVQLTTISLPSAGYDYYPVVFAKTTSVGTVNTSFTLSAILNPSGSADVIASDVGITGIASQKLTMGASYGSLVGTGYGKVTAGNTALVKLQIQQTALTADSWGTSHTSLAVMTVPVGWP